MLVVSLVIQEVLLLVLTIHNVYSLYRLFLVLLRSNRKSWYYYGPIVNLKRSLSPKDNYNVSVLPSVVIGIVLLEGVDSPFFLNE